MGFAKYIGRVGALAVALGIGTGLAATPSVASAEPSDSGSSSVTLTDAHDRSAGGEPVHRRHVGGWFPGEDGLAIVHGAEHVRLALNSFLVS
jgi:hypothetical protein